MTLNYLKEINEFYNWLETNHLSSSAISLWHALMHIANKTQWKSEFSVALSVLTIKTSLQKDALIVARKSLQQSGRIEWESRAGNQCAVYRIVPLASEKPTLTQPQDLHVSEKPTQSPPQTPAQSPPQTIAINKQDINEIKRDTYGRSSPTESDRPNGFDLFWEAYPRRVKKSDALRAWGQVKADNLVDTIMAALDQFKTSPEWTKDSGQFIPYPASWLRGRRWEDELSVRQPASSPKNYDESF